LPSSPRLSVYLKWTKKKSKSFHACSNTSISSASDFGLPTISMPTSLARPLYIG
jgi:hypothetical protein